MTGNLRIPIEVTAAVMVRERKVLLARRKGGELDGLWEFPGGKMESGESWAVAIEREILEELEWEVTARNRLLVIEHDYPGKRVRLHFIHCEISKGASLPVGQGTLSEADWFDPFRIPGETKLCPPDRIALSRIPWEELFSKS